MLNFGKALDPDNRSSITSKLEGDTESVRKKREMDHEFGGG